MVYTIILLHVTWLFRGGGGRQCGEGFFESLGGGYCQINNAPLLRRRFSVLITLWRQKRYWSHRWWLTDDQWRTHLEEFPSHSKLFYTKPGVRHQILFQIPNDKWRNFWVESSVYCTIEFRFVQERSGWSRGGSIGSPWPITQAITIADSTML